jgi:hypothetical protein
MMILGKVITVQKLIFLKFNNNANNEKQRFFIKKRLKIDG